MGTIVDTSKIRLHYIHNMTEKDKYLVRGRPGRWYQKFDIEATENQMIYIYEENPQLELQLWEQIIRSAFPKAVDDDGDSRSIRDHENIRQHWEAQITKGNVAIFPRHKVESKIEKSTTNNFKSEVETTSISFDAARSHWNKLDLN